MRAIVLERLSVVLNKDVYKIQPGTELPRGTVLLAGGIKSGSSWMQHILHGLRSGGDMGFEEINIVVPILELSKMTGLGVSDEQKYQPPIFKAHSQFQSCPRAEKVIVVTRDPDDAAVSFYYFFVDYAFTRDELGIDDFVEMFILEEGDDGHPSLNATQMKHLASWFPHRNDDNVLWLHYEDLKADLKQCIKLISDFLDIGVGNQELLDLVERQSSLEFMKEHASKFSARDLRRVDLAAEFLPYTEERDVNIGDKVRSGAVKESKQALSEETKTAMKQKWMELLQPVTGYESYDEMRAAVNEELGRSFPA